MNDKNSTALVAFRSLHGDGSLISGWFVRIFSAVIFSIKNYTAQNFNSWAFEEATPPMDDVVSVGVFQLTWHSFKHQMIMVAHHSISADIDRK